jgi:hypothetical protein
MKVGVQRVYLMFSFFLVRFSNLLISSLKFIEYFQISFRFSFNCGNYLYPFKKKGYFDNEMKCY